MKISNYRLYIDGLELDADIGIHDFERAQRQRIRISVEIEIEPSELPEDDNIAGALDYDWVRRAICELVANRRFDLQETLARAIVDLVALRREVTAVVVSTEKPDVYSDAVAVGCRLEARK